MPLQNLRMNQTLILLLERATYQYDKNKINILDFGQMEPVVASMIDEINVVTRKLGSQLKKTVCCLLLFFILFLASSVHVAYNDKDAKAIQEKVDSQKQTNFGKWWIYLRLH